MDFELDSRPDIPPENKRVYFTITNDAERLALDTLARRIGAMARTANDKVLPDVCDYLRRGLASDERRLSLSYSRFGMVAAAMRHVPGTIGTWPLQYVQAQWTAANQLKDIDLSLPDHLPDTFE